MKVQLLLLSLSLLLLHSCISKEEDVVNVGLLNGPSSIGMVQAIENKTYHDGLKVHYHIKDNPQHLRALLQSGNMDMAILPMTMAYNMIDNNIDIKIFAITGWGNLFMLSRDSSVDFNHIEKSIISVPGEGQTPDLVSQFLIEYLGLQDKVSLNYTYPSPLLLTSALAVGKVAYAILPEPLASLALNKDQSLYRTLNIAELWEKSLPEIPLVQSVFVVKGSFYKKNMEWFNSFADALEICALDVVAHPTAAIKLAKTKELLPPLGFDSTIIANSRLDFERDGNIADTITRYLSTFYELDKEFDIEEYIIRK
ncbi:MAG: hypothetical protein PF444_10195 [Bacteroidales bacterium]|jgi:NitT/TauT family transport system substrate-binding protein|nr:hypothetical protein [Bacteroidales bacterium]